MEVLMPTSDRLAGPDGFEGFVAARYPALLRAAYVLTGERGLAEDLVQSALLRAYPIWRRTPPEHPEAYVRTIMVRLAVRGRRKLWRAEVPTAQLPERGTNPMDAVDLSDAVRVALAELSMGHRAVVVLRYLAGLSEAETASILRCSVGTVKSRSSRALACLRAGGLLTDEEVSHD
jgi:RNA polymerase sigma-70 factor (sigma-E family)